MKTGMKRYIEQLLEDLEVCISNATQKLSVFFDNSICLEYFPITDEEDGGVKVSDLIGIEAFFFPQLDYLNSIEAKELTVKMIRLYRAYGLNPVFSFCVPDKIKYGQLRDCLSNEVYPEQGQMVDVEMCDYLPVHCPFASICPSVQSTGKCCDKRKRRA